MRAKFIDARNATHTRTKIREPLTTAVRLRWPAARSRPSVCVHPRTRARASPNSFVRRVRRVSASSARTPPSCVCVCVRVCVSVYVRSLALVLRKHDVRRRRRRRSHLLQLCLAREYYAYILDDSALKSRSTRRKTQQR